MGSSMSYVPEDGFDVFEFAKYLEECGLLRRSYSLPSELTKRVSSTGGKFLSMSSRAPSTRCPSNESSDGTCVVDYIETAYELLHDVCSGYDEIRNIVTGGAADGWYPASSPVQSLSSWFGTVPVSTLGTS